MKKLKKTERLNMLERRIKQDPFLTDEKLAEIFQVSIQTIRLDRLELNIPELRVRIQNVAENEKDNIRSLSLQEVIGEIVDIELNTYAYSLFIIEEGHVFERNNIARGHYLFAQANSLCVALIDHPLALTKHASIDFIKPVKLNDKVISKAIVNAMDGKIAHVTVESKVDQTVVFKGKFEMYYKNEGESKW